MNIKTKFNPGDIVFFLHNSRVEQEKIDHINLTVKRTYSNNPIEVSIRYFFGWDDNNAISKSESEVFTSLSLLKKNMIVNKK